MRIVRTENDVIEETVSACHGLCPPIHQTAYPIDGEDSPSEEAERTSSISRPYDGSIHHQYGYRPLALGELRTDPF